MGMRPNVASSGEEALAMLRAAEAARDPYAIAVIDYQMPEMNGEDLGKLIKADKLLADTSLVLFTSSGQPGDAKRISELGFAGYLTKTTSVETMRDVLATVWSNAKSGRLDVRLVTRHSVAEARAALETPETVKASAPELRVLIAEDNIVNQKVAKRMLEKLGCVVDVAANGEEAVDMWSKLPYDVVFMDCQMPELDGYAATAQIRERENGDAHTPIVAMTANAMEGDRDRCLDAGMDDYIAKPIRVEVCREVLERSVKAFSRDKLVEDEVTQTAGG
jgi:CheY-like chemotaxis protein